MQYTEAELAEMRHLLKRNTELLEENNRILKKLHRSAVWSFWFRVIFYVLAIGLPFAMYYYFLEPYLASMTNSYESVLERVNSFPGFEGMESFFKQPE